MANVRPGPPDARKSGAMILNSCRASCASGGLRRRRRDALVWLAPRPWRFGRHSQCFAGYPPAFVVGS